MYSDSTSSSASSSPSPVSWQSACLGLAPLALNAMTQPSSLDAPFSQSSLLFASRSSPFVCLADALGIITSLVIHVLRGKPPRQAALLVNWQRARHRLGEDVEELEDIPAEKHPWGFVILLVAAVLQAAKIIGFKGVFWTKAWAIVYLSSYVVIAGVGFLAPKDWRDRPPNCRSYLNFKALSQVLLWAALAAHLVCCGWILDRIIVGESTPELISFWYAYVPLVVQGLTTTLLALMLAALITLVLLVLLSCLAGIVDQCVNPFHGEISWNFSRPVDVVRIPLIILVGIGEFCLFWYLDEMLIGLLWKHDMLEASVFFTFARGSINLLLLIGLFWLTKGLLALLAVWIPLLGRFNSLANSHGYLVVFVCWNFIQALLYYRLRYDSKGTIKPPWTDYLG